MGPKNSAAPTHFIQSPRSTPRRKKHSRINKESPNCQEASSRTILSSPTEIVRKKSDMPLKITSPSVPSKND